MTMSLPIKRAIAGALLAQGAPLGWLLLKWLGSGASPLEEVVKTPGLYIYLVVSTTLIFCVFGSVLGAYESRLKRINAELQELSSTDALTGLSNVRTLIQNLPKLISYAHRTGASLSVVMFDVDRFKPVNDKYGHLAGDDLLRRLGHLLMDGRRREDIVARIGGEEFLIVLPGIDSAGAERVAARVLDLVSNMEFSVDRVPVSITLSAGVAELAAQDDERQILARADAALYRAKQSGRNCVSFANSSY